MVGLQVMASGSGEAGREEGNKKTMTENLEVLGIDNDWKEERMDADSLLRSLHQAHCDDEKHRKWLLRRWPEWPSEDLRNSLPDPERFIPECFLRDCEDDVSHSFQSIKNLVRESFSRLDEEADEGEQLDVPTMVGRLSDEGVAEAFSLLLPKLQRKALHSILSILTARKRLARNRPWLLEKINTEWRAFAGTSEDDESSQRLQSIIAVFRDPDSFQKEVPPGKILLKGSCPYSAAHSALEQLDQLPLQCLQVMLEVLLEKPPDLMVGKLPVGGNKNRVATSLWEKGRALLSDRQAGEALPEPLRKSLMVMSVSATYAFGDDGNLMNFLGPLSLENKLLHSSLFSALSKLNKLNYDNLQQIYSELIGAPKVYRKRHPGNLRESIKKVLLDCLLRFEVRPVPEDVKQAASKIRALARQQVGQYRETKSVSKLKPTTLVHDVRNEIEVEATLRVSSHLQQIIYYWNEALTDRSSRDKEGERCLSELKAVNCSVPHEVRISEVGEITSKRKLDIGMGASRDAALHVKEESLVIRLTDEDNGGMKTQRQSESFDEAALAEDMQIDQTEEMAVVAKKTKLNLQEYENEELSLVETKEVQRLTRIADEAAEVGYALIGCAMERTARSSGVLLKRPVRKYLRSGLTRKVPASPGEGMDVEQHQLAMILRIAEKIPIISPRVMGSVRRRLGMG